MVEARQVTLELALMKRLEAEIDAIEAEIAPLNRRLDRVLTRLQAAQKRVRCKLVPGCTRLKGHPGAHNT